MGYLFSMTAIILLFTVFLAAHINISEKEFDQLFENIDSNVSVNLKESFANSDKNLSKFVQYTAKGIIYETKGTAYLGKYLNQFYPWIAENWQLLFYLIILLAIAPLLSPVGYVVFGLILWIMDLIKDYFKKRKKMEAR